MKEYFDGIEIVTMTLYKVGYMTIRGFVPINPEKVTAKGGIMDKKRIEEDGYIYSHMGDYECKLVPSDKIDGNGNYRD